MDQHDNDNPTEVTKDALLRFLDTVPQAGDRRQRFAQESPSAGEVSRTGALNNSGAQQDSAPAPCPGRSSYIRLLLGTAGVAESERLLSHAATCELCGELLATTLSALDGDPSPEEAKAIAELASSKFPWQDSMARELASTKAQKPSPQRPGVRSGSNRGSHLGYWLTVGIAATLAAGVGFFLWQKRADAPEHLLATAYSQSRTLELRIPDAAYSAVVAGAHTRGAGADHESAPLLEARAGLARELEHSPQDAHWLELQARADVLEEHYDAATDVLDRLIATGPVTAELLADAAAAYYQRGLASGSELDRSTALDYLRRADELAPADPLILFNEAIVMEDRGQMMNAVEVWNRYITVERDERWAAEGKRRRDALEQKLNRLKSHQSRIRQMLATPQAMDALAGDTKKLAGLDEELSSYELNALLKSAFPGPVDAASSPEILEQARGSPCPSICMAARRLLQATATSLEIQHHDFWLSDLLSAHIDSLSAATAADYGQALRLLGQASREDQTGTPAEGARMASQARRLFLHLKANAGADASLRTSAGSGEERSAVEYMFALQRQVDFRDCRALAEQWHLHSRPEAGRSPWVKAAALITEKVCDDTPETRRAGRALELTALHLAQANNYPLLTARVEMRVADDAQDAGDEETAERVTLATFRELISADPPPIRVVNTIGGLTYVEEASSRGYTSESYDREALSWQLLIGDRRVTTLERMDLARTEMRIGAMKKAENQLLLAGTEGGANFSEAEILMANSLLERGDLAGTARYLDQAAGSMAKYSDTWGLRTYAAARGQLELALGNFGEAARILESDIRISEGNRIHSVDRATVAEYAEQDHDLYAELAATWLAQGRTPESVLALWERFRLRSRGLPITQCRGGALDCEQPVLLAARRGLGDSLLIGQILLLDRVLVYRVDQSGVQWSQKPLRRQDILDAAEKLERAVSSPYTSPETAARLGARLSDALLPKLPASMNANIATQGAALLLEPDPMLQNLSWPVLPTPEGALGLQYPLAEVRSILVVTEERGAGHPDTGLESGKRALVVGASVADEGESPLPEALNEAGSVERILHAQDLLLGGQATAGRVAESLGSAAIFHFAGHALQTLNGTELLLAAAPGEKRPWVDGEFLRQHPPRACRLAVLSACATGVREAAWNHPLQDIVETLGSLGVPEVVATRWQIDSGAAVPFMDTFYQSLERGTSVAVALSSARKVLSRQSLYSNPYYWGAYYITGRETTQNQGAHRDRIEKSQEAKKE
jgi:CHAT domain-containing protein